MKKHEMMVNILDERVFDQARTFGKRKMSSRWALWLLTVDQKQNLVTISK